MQRRIEKEAETTGKTTAEISEKPDTTKTADTKKLPDTAEKICIRVREHRIVPAGGVLILVFTLFILVMGLKYPSVGANHFVFGSALLLFAVIGIVCCIVGSLRGLRVEGMHIQYVNWRGRKKSFTLDDIGYCRLVLSSNQHYFIVYDLLGDKLCKLEFEMRGSGEFFQYLLDNHVRVEWKAEQSGKVDLAVTEASLRLRETAICEDEIPACTEALYRRVREAFSEWEKQNKILGAYWEFGYAEFSARDLKETNDLWNCVNADLGMNDGLPEDYVCMLEAYLKKDNEYVIDKKNEPVCMLIPYLTRSASYQIGEKLRLRKMNEETVLHWTEGQLEALAKTLPRRKYHTEPFVLKHELRMNAGIRR